MSPVNLLNYLLLLKDRTLAIEIRIRIIKIFRYLKLTTSVFFKKKVQNEIYCVDYRYLFNTIQFSILIV